MGENDEDKKDLFSPEWTLGSCFGPKPRFNYDQNNLVYDRCCLLPGQHTLTCINKKSKYGWGNVTFEIDGKRYCDDFFGYTAMRKISFNGKKLFID